MADSSLATIIHLCFKYCILLTIIKALLLFCYYSPQVITNITENGPDCSKGSGRSSLEPGSKYHKRAVIKFTHLQIGHRGEKLEHSPHGMSPIHDAESNKMKCTRIWSMWSISQQRYNLKISIECAFGEYCASLAINATQQMALRVVSMALGL